MSGSIPSLIVQTTDPGVHQVVGIANDRETSLLMAHDIRESPLPVTVQAVNQLAELDGKQVMLRGVAIADTDGNWLVMNVSCTR